MQSGTLPQVLHTYQNHILDSTRWERYSPRDDDIIVSSSFKSGTTWTQSIVRELIVHSLDQHDANVSVPLPDGESSLWVDDSREADKKYEQLEAQTHRRSLKTHLPLDGLSFYPQVKYIVLGRDARDVFMSLWNHYSGLGEQFYQILNNAPNLIGPPMPYCPEDIHLFWKNWISRGWFDWEQEGYPFWGNMHHTQTWWNYRHLDNIQFFHYADMLADPKAEIKRMATFLGIEVSDEVLTAIIQETSLSTMRERAVRNSYIYFKEGAKTFFFKAMNGRWRGVLSEDELTMYETTKSQVLTPDCARWLEQGRVALSWPK